MINQHEITIRAINEVINEYEEFTMRDVTERIRQLGGCTLFVGGGLYADQHIHQVYIERRPGGPVLSYDMNTEVFRRV